MVFLSQRMPGFLSVIKNFKKMKKVLEGDAASPFIIELNHNEWLTEWRFQMSAARLGSRIGK